MNTRYFLLGTQDTMYQYEENNLSIEELDFYEVVAFEEQDVTEMMQYVVDYGYFVEINEEIFNEIVNL